MLNERLNEFVYRQSSESKRAAYYQIQSQVDLAHVVMLGRQGIINGDVSTALLGAIEELRREDFRELLNRPAPRGDYIAYESLLIENLGLHIGGSLQTGRSRNDLNATIHSLMLREAWLRTLSTTSAVLESLAAQANEHRKSSVPGFSHFQPAMPSTLGAYFANVGISLMRIQRQLLHLQEYFDFCPLGACAGYGTSLPIDPDHTALLLGYKSGPEGSIFSVSDRSASSLMLALIGEIAVLYSRVAADLQYWSSGPVGIIRFPDSLVGQSSIMPQKRNAFVLENIKGRCGEITAAREAALMASKSSPYANSIEVATESIAEAMPAIDAFAGLSELLRSHVDLAEPDLERSREIMQDGNVYATFDAERLVADKHVAFREAYNRTRENISSGSRREPTQSFEDAVAEYGAGPDPANTVRISTTLKNYLATVIQTIAEVEERSADGNALLRREMEAVQ